MEIEINKETLALQMQRQQQQAQQIVKQFL